MSNKTPKFNQALKEILDSLQPHQRECKECGKNFKIMAEDIEFYKKLKVPPPTLCPDCREQKRAGYRINYLPIFYKKSCSVPGHTEKIVSFYAENNPVKVYDDKYYFSDQWETTEFGIDYDPEKSFFEEYNKFALKVPHQSLFKDPQSVNSDYVVAGIQAKDCYYVASPIFSEKIYYGWYPENCKESINICEIKKSELCFDCVYTNASYNCIHCVSVDNCLNSSFLYDCHNCQNCFMSVNLRNKSYVFRNQQLSKEEYQEKMKEIEMGKKSVYEKLQKEFNQLVEEKAIKKNLDNVKTENVFGDKLIECKDCFKSFSLVKSENIRYGFVAKEIKDCMDFWGGTKNSLLYESSGVADSSQVKFSLMMRTCSEVEYSFECSNCENCFACFGLKNKKYHIFNKPYSKEEYWQKVDELKTEMLKRGEYGEFFPLKDSPFPYQDSNAQIEFPLTEEEIKAKGWHWQDEVPSEIDLTKIKTIKAEDVPDDIKDITDEILKTPIICARTKKPFKVTPFELDFYRKMNVPLPIIHPLERVKDLFKYKRGYKLYPTTCTKCQKEIQTVHNPEEVKNIYCEECYTKEVV